MLGEELHGASPNLEAWATGDVVVVRALQIPM
jgi:hypothetical protein